MSPATLPLLLYTPADSPRLQFVLQWIFGERLRLDWRLTHDAAGWLHYEGPRISYSSEPTHAGQLRVWPQGLLHASDIVPQEIQFHRWKHSSILFYNQPGAAIPFDIFAAVFYLVSRYEEYLPHKTDRHGRYEAAQSVAAQYAFLQEPVVDQWLQQLRILLEKKYNLRLARDTFRFQPSYDIDIAWKYRHKDTRRHWGGYARDLLRLNLRALRGRAAVNAGRLPDPYDSFAWLDQLHEQYQLEPLYFLLLGQRPTAFDKNADPALPAMRQLVQGLAQRYRTGIHPSYASHEDPAQLPAEIGLLAQASGQKVSRSRQHYIRFTLPGTYRRLIDAGITEDYSMGYASVNGFRAGTSQSFPWYDLEAERETGLRIHPFVFMEATAKFYNRQGPDAAWQEWERLWHAVRQTGGTFTSIWHNHLLGTDADGRDWRALYLKMLAYAQG